MKPPIAQQAPLDSESPEAVWKPLVIGDRLRLETPLVLAPLAGHTDRAFRAMVRGVGGCGLVVTEMVSSEGLTRGSTMSRELAVTTESERPVGIQIFGSNPERIGDAAAMAEELGADLVDINMGCPVPKVTRTGSGAALMKDAQKAGELVASMVKRSSLPVTVKIRSGWDYDSINAPDVARVLEDSGASAITVHPRCRSERHRGTAAWPVIRRVKEAVAIPVIGNGDVHCAQSARRMIEQTGADGIMVGRGALTNPWVFKQIVDGIEGRPIEEPGPADYQDLFQRFIENLKEYLPERVVVNRVKAFIGWVTKGLSGGAALRKDIFASKSLPEVEQVFARYFEKERGGVEVR